MVKKRWTQPIITEYGFKFMQGIVDAMDKDGWEQTWGGECMKQQIIIKVEQEDREWLSHFPNISAYIRYLIKRDKPRQEQRMKMRVGV